MTTTCSKATDIHCPHCAWRPGPLDRWVYTPPCGTVFNTFWTRAVCPRCGVRWPKTQRRVCGVFSPHERRYHRLAGERTEEKASRAPAKEDTRRR